MKMKHEIVNVNDVERLSDLGLVTSASLFLPIEAVDRDPKHSPRVFFLFRKTAELEQLISRYWSGQLQVTAQDFFNQLKKIKARIYGE